MCCESGDWNRWGCAMSGSPFGVLQRLLETEKRIADPGNAGTITADRDLGVVALTSTTTETRTVADPADIGIRMAICGEVVGGNITLTFSSAYDESGNTTKVISATGQYMELVSVAQGSRTYVWREVGSGPAGIVNVTASTVTLSPGEHAGQTVTLNRAAGVAVTLPAATGTGNRYKLFVGTTVTSNNITVTRAGSDTLFGMIYQLADGGATLVAYECPGSTVITLNGTTTGGIKGDTIELIDVASATWSIIGHTSATGTEATPVT